ncbi:conserved Plasmodium protein, unknown function [Plasmodium malariae]|uniref:Uncharacterized protein n=1 Tax=Plasmodium malariae TaxID=5858 RepID=A0A1A8WLE6_PLAMA|nr:conserved Plasmodium protein, unknown function [Plasmodium malariae]
MTDHGAAHQSEKVQGKREQGVCEDSSLDGASRLTYTLDESIFNLDEGKLHAVLRKNKYELTKVNMRMSSIIYKYLYMHKKKKSMLMMMKKRKWKRKKGSSPCNALQEGRNYLEDGEALHEKDLKHAKGPAEDGIVLDVQKCSYGYDKGEKWYDKVEQQHDDGGNTYDKALEQQYAYGQFSYSYDRASNSTLSKDINFLYIEYFIHKKKIVKLRNIYKYIYDKKHLFYLKKFGYKNVYLLSAECTLPEVSYTDGGADRGTTNENGRSGTIHVQRYSYNSNFLCLQNMEDEIAIYSMKRLNINSLIFFKNRENNKINEDQIKTYLDELVITEKNEEHSCVKLNFNYKSTACCILKNEKIKNIQNVDINNMNKLCICTGSSIYIYEIFLKELDVRYKYLYSYHEKSDLLGKENKIWYSYLSNEKKLIYFTFYNIIYLNSNSHIFNSHIFTITKDIKCKYKILNISIYKNLLVVSYYNKISILYNDKVYFVVEFDDEGDVISYEGKGKEVIVPEQQGEWKRHKNKMINKQKNEMSVEEENCYFGGEVDNSCDRLNEQQVHYIPFLCVLEGNNLFCVGYGKKLTIIEYTSKILIKKKFTLSYSLYYLKSCHNNILILYDKYKLYICQIMYIKKEHRLFLLFEKTITDINSSLIFENSTIFESFSEAIKVNMRSIKINRSDHIARYIFQFFNKSDKDVVNVRGGGRGSGSSSGVPSGNGEHDNSGLNCKGDTIHFYINLVYIYILNKGKVDIVVINSWIYLIYLFFYYKRYNILLILMLYIYNVRNKRSQSEMSKSFGGWGYSCSK